MRKWGDTTICAELPAFAPQHNYPPKIIPEIPFLAKVSALARKGLLSLFISELVKWESLGGPGESQTGRSGHLFDWGMFTKIQSGLNVELRLVGRGVDADGYGGQLQAALQKLADQDLRSLVRHVGPAHLVDAAHLITATRHHLDYFLCDGEFLLSFDSNVSRRDRARFSQPITPSRLISQLDSVAPVLRAAD
jgi:hypothetical protein